MRSMRLGKIIIFILMISLINPNSNAADLNPIPGKKCSKLNTQVRLKTKIFTCIKSGKYIVWSVGKEIKNKESNQVRAKTESETKQVDKLPQNTSSTEVIKQTETLQISNSPQPLSVCRIPDQSPQGNRKEGPSIAYPVPTGSKYAQIPNKGQIKVAIVPIDFPDVQGIDQPEAIYRNELTVIDEWIKWYSNGQSYFSWEAGKKWIRAPKESSEYVAMDTPNFDRGNPIPGSRVGREINSVQIASEFYDLAAKELDLSKIHAVLFVYPKNIVNIYDLIVRNASDQGIGNPAKPNFKPQLIDERLLKTWIMSTGAMIYRNEYPLWSWMLHEILHNLGLQGHAPNQGSPLGIMTNQWGASFALNAWDTTILDWQRENDVYCIKKDELKTSSKIMLVPLERELVGNKSIMVKLSDAQVLVIESHRRDKWSSGHLNFPGLPESFKGLVVYKVDTTKTPLYGVVEPDGSSWRDSSEAFAYYIRNPGVSHGYLNTRYGRLDLNFVIYEGEFLTTNGIRIELNKSSDFDTVEIAIA